MNDLSYQERMDTLKIISDQGLALSKIHASLIQTFAVLAIRGSFILNGSAAIAILTKLENIDATAKGTIWTCGWGALLAVVSAGLSYLSQVEFAKAATKEFNNALTCLKDGTIPRPMKRPRLGFTFQLLAVATIVLSLALFMQALFRFLPLLSL